MQHHHIYMQQNKTKQIAHRNKVKGVCGIAIDHCLSRENKLQAELAGVWAGGGLLSEYLLADTGRCAHMPWQCIQFNHAARAVQQF